MTYSPRLPLAAVEITAMPNKVLAKTHKKGLEGAYKHTRMVGWAA
jgi:hypothetical protein